MRRLEAACRRGADEGVVLRRRARVTGWQNEVTHSSRQCVPSVQPLAVADATDRWR